MSSLIDSILQAIAKKYHKAHINFDELDKYEKEQIDRWKDGLKPETLEQKFERLKTKLQEELEKSAENLGGYEISVEKRLFFTAYYRIMKMIKECIESEGVEAEGVKAEIREIYGDII